MSVKPKAGGKTLTAKYWKDCYEQQRFLVNSMTSLLNRYGSSIEREQLYSAFVLTLMGQFVVSDAGYYTYSPKDWTLTPKLAYGRLGLTELPFVALGPEQVRRLHGHPAPTSMSDLSTNLMSASGMKFLSSNYRIFAPLFLKDKLVGVLFLGAKVSGEEYTKTDLDVMQSLCSVSATTFNNAILYENARHSAREIRRLYEVRDEVINRITHEFRTPLTIIKAGVGILEKEDGHEELVRLFSESEARLEDLINSLLSLSHKNSGEHTVDVRSNPVALLHDSIHRCSETASQKGVQFHVVQDTGSTPPVLHMKESDFRTILDALLENAIKFSPNGATVTVEIERSAEAPSVERDGLQLPDWRQQTENLIREYSTVDPSGQVGTGELGRSARVTGERHHQYLVIRILDKGIGIPEQDLMSVAEPFRQASNSPDLGVKGTGLGLALVHKVVSFHGGHLCCRSAEGSGTTFSVYLPIEGDSGF
jgi:signal transduction histidine kinase